jgi:hypothetical protein
MGSVGRLPPEADEVGIEAVMFSLEMFQWSMLFNWSVKVGRRTRAVHFTTQPI